MLSEAKHLPLCHFERSEKSLLANKKDFLTSSRAIRKGFHPPCKTCEMFRFAQHDKRKQHARLFYTILELIPLRLC
ncbi:hypothetical protein LS77_011395 [Helicobacter bilis]|uniref:Uncharacterized protein n=1 Tax=Helicobacter bilis TaxID=37372 RepID=A0A6D2C6E3_9HELI|nr:hypothetical protein [Helicobacter bilis]TLE01847.1 hypothetical protein LS77_011395 [Helicobacter bilis]TLE02518.1 hypothetical protein LS76_011305 [Helicobacter bilis]